MIENTLLFLVIMYLFSMETEKSFSTMLSWLPSGTYLMYQYFDIIEICVDVHDGFICAFLGISQRFFP